jgi:hypothetical protein
LWRWRCDHAQAARRKALARTSALRRSFSAAGMVPTSRAGNSRSAEGLGFGMLGGGGGGSGRGGRSSSAGSVRRTQSAGSTGREGGRGGGGGSGGGGGYTPNTQLIPDGSSASLASAQWQQPHGETAPRAYEQDDGWEALEAAAHPASPDEPRPILAAGTAATSWRPRSATSETRKGFTHTAAAVGERGRTGSGQRRGRGGGSSSASAPKPRRAQSAGAPRAESLSLRRSSLSSDRMASYRVYPFFG